MLAVAGQGVPGVCAGDHQQIPGGLDRLGYLDRGVAWWRLPGPRFDLIQFPVGQQAELLVQVGDGLGVTASWRSRGAWALPSL